MKTLYSLLFTFFVLSSTAQTNQLIDNLWQLHNVEINDEVVDAEIGLGDDYPFLGFDEYNGTFYFIFDNLDGFLDLTQDNQQFTIPEGSLNLGDIHGTEAASLVVNEFFLSDPYNYVFNNPFSYSFQEEGEVIFLYITNPNDDVATFFTTTLNNTNFKNIEFSVYPNPTSNLLHIETSQTDITAIGIFDVKGKQVMQLSSADLRNVDVSHLTNGIYFLKVGTSEGEFTKKFVKN